MRTSRGSADQVSLSRFFAGRVQDFVYKPGLNGARSLPRRTMHPVLKATTQYAPIRFPRQDFFNFAELTPAIPAVDREYLYGSLDRKICDQYLEIFADFKYARTFWDGAVAPVPFFPDVWTDATHPFGSLVAAGHQRTDSEPIQSIHGGGLHLAWRI